MHTPFVRALIGWFTFSATAFSNGLAGPNVVADPPKSVDRPAAMLGRAALMSAVQAFDRVSMLAIQAQGNALGWAIASRKPRLAEWMLFARLDPNVKDSTGITPLLHAVTAEDWKTAAQLLTKGADPLLTGPQGISPLMIAASAGHVETLEALLQHGADVNAADEKRRTALHYALATRKRQALERLLAADAQVGTGEADIFPVAAETRDWTLIEPVLQRYESRKWDTPARVCLQDALSAKNVDRLRLLLTKHAGPATQEGSKDPLLAYAVVRNNLEMAQLLISAGADPNMTLPGKPEDQFLGFVGSKTLKHYLTNEPGMTMLAIAAGMGHNSMVQLLLQHGAEKNRPTKSKHRLIPLYFAAWSGHAECLQTLIGNAPSPEQMRVEISLGLQQATLYKNGAAVFTTDISSGQPETPTPTGRFVVTDKKRHHVSNLYDARMPYFMRLSCKDFGLHEGHLPGYPASHGCIRLPNESARKLFRDVPIGTLVTIR